LAIAQRSAAEPDDPCCAHACGPAAAACLLHDRRGLSTLEYALIFVLILVGALALWNKLGQSLNTQLAGGEAAFSSTLQNARRAADLPLLAADALRGTAPNPGRPASASAVAEATHDSTPAHGSAARASHVSTAGAKDPSPVVTSTLAAVAAPPPSAATANNVPVAADGDWRSQRVGTGGKVAVAAAGALAGAAMAAGTNIATAYVASLACGPGAPVCAGAVTVAVAVGLAGYGVHELMNGGWSALKGSFSRVFSSEDATVGDALSVGSTLGAAAYGIGTTGLSGASGAARGEAIAQLGARAGAATRAEIAGVVTGSAPEVAAAGVPSATANAVPPVVRRSPVEASGASDPAATSGTATSTGAKLPEAKPAASGLTAASGARNAAFFDDIAKSATRNPNSTKVVLGKFLEENRAYTKVAAHYGASYFKVENWAQVTKGLSRAETWKINEAFIRQQIQAGKQIILSHDPAKATGFFAQEVTYLEGLGYKFVKENWVWKAVR
jgi:Flp pilus assembly pilin Flp